MYIERNDSVTFLCPERYFGMAVKLVHGTPIFKQKNRLRQTLFKVKISTFNFIFNLFSIFLTSLKQNLFLVY